MATKMQKAQGAAGKADAKTELPERTKDREERAKSADKDKPRRHEATADANKVQAHDRALKGGAPTPGVPSETVDQGYDRLVAPQPADEKDTGKAVPFFVRDKDQFIDGHMYKPLPDGAEPMPENTVMLTPRRVETLRAAGCVLESEDERDERLEKQQAETDARLAQEQADRELRVGEEHIVTGLVAEENAIANRDANVVRQKALANRDAQSSKVGR